MEDVTCFECGEKGDGKQCHMCHTHKCESCWELDNEDEVCRGYVRRLDDCDLLYYTEQHAVCKVCFKIEAEKILNKE